MKNICCCVYVHHLQMKYCEKPVCFCTALLQGDKKNGNFWKTPQKIEEIQEKKFIDRNWTITTCLLRDSNPNYQCLKMTSCRWRPPRMHSFTATKHFKSSHSFVSPCVCCMLCRMRRSQIESMSPLPEESSYYCPSIYLRQGLPTCLFPTVPH